jgi:hypothetical protein
MVSRIALSKDNALEKLRLRLAVHETELGVDSWLNRCGLDMARPVCGRLSGFDHYEGSPSRPIALHRYIYANDNPISLYDPTGYTGYNDVSASMGIMTGLFAIGIVGIGYFLVHKTPETDYSANWSAGVGAVEHTYTSVKLYFPTTSASAEQLQEEIYNDLRDFKYFDSPTPNIATVRLQGRRAFFDARGMFGYGSDRLNADEVAVELFDGPWSREISGMTLGAHQLVGIRRWRVVIDQFNPPVLRVETEAFEQSAGHLNDIGRTVIGQERQYDVWVTYLSNIAAHWQSTAGASPSGISCPPVQKVGSKNPWRADLPPGYQ